MSLSLTKTFKVKNSTPYLNTRISSGSFKRSSNNISATQKIRQKKQLVEWFKTRPELNSPVLARVNDTIRDINFFKPDGKPLGATTRKRAEKWWRDNFMDDRLKSIWTDAIITGEGFGWKGKPSKSQLKTVIDEVVSSNINTKDLDFDVKSLKKELLSKAMDEDSKIVRVFDYIASSTMEVEHTNTSITCYVQQVATNKQTFNVEEVIRFPFTNINGEVNGYTPILSLASELILIWFIKENMLAYMRNNGVPKKVFTLLEENANSANHKYLIEQLSDLGAVQNRHGNLVLTGKIDVKDLEEKIKDMDYKELALYVTSNIAYALQIPVSRIPYMIGKAQSAGDAGGLAEAGYWSMIGSDQRKIENLLNTQMFERMGWVVKFKKEQKIDDLRETQAMSMKADAITKIQSIFGLFGKKLTINKVIDLMDLSEDDVSDLTPEEKEGGLEKTGLNNQNLLNNQELIRGTPAAKKAERSKNAAVNNPKNLPQNGI